MAEIYNTEMRKPLDWITNGEFDVWNFLADNSGKWDYYTADTIYHYFELSGEEQKKFQQETSIISNLSEEELMSLYNEVMQRILGDCLKELGEQLLSGNIKVDISKPNPGDL